MEKEPGIGSQVLAPTGAPKAHSIAQPGPFECYQNQTARSRPPRDCDPNAVSIFLLQRPHITWGRWSLMKVQFWKLMPSNRMLWGSKGRRSESLPDQFRKGLKRGDWDGPGPRPYTHLPGNAIQSKKHVLRERGDPLLYPQIIWLLLPIKKVEPGLGQQHVGVWRSQVSGFNQIPWPGPGSYT